jgi:hypothetical protein
VERLEAAPAWDAQKLRHNALRFRWGIFRKGILETVNGVLEKAISH